MVTIEVPVWLWKKFMEDCEISTKKKDQQYIERVSRSLDEILGCGKERSNRDSGIPYRRGYTS